MTELLLDWHNYDQFLRMLGLHNAPSYTFYGKKRGFHITVSVALKLFIVQSLRASYNILNMLSNNHSCTSLSPQTPSLYKERYNL